MNFSIYLKINNNTVVITKFKVSNFKSFNEEFVLDLEDTNGYSFNRESIKDGVVNNALVYGHNGVGKSNLAFAIFDIIGHLTDNRKDETEYHNYLNAYNKSKNAIFKYELLINSNKVVYEYHKSDYKSIVYEMFSINGKIFAKIDRKINNVASIGFLGAQNLKTQFYTENLSLLKYIKNNSILDRNDDNETFESFFKFIEGMLFFRSLRSNFFIGLMEGNIGLSEYIINKNKVLDFQFFLNKAGIECKLTVIKDLDKDVLAFDFNGKKIPFLRIASHGTVTLILVYYWLQRIKGENEVSFLFIDEFDAFYHHELSTLIIEELKKTGVQFILTTHNTSNISNDLLRPDCYFLMYKDQIRSLAKSTSKELREAHNIEKMYKAGSFNV